MLKKITAIALLSALTFATAHAKSTPTEKEKEKDDYAICLLLSHLSYQAMINYQNGLSQSQNNTQLHQQFAQTLNSIFGQDIGNKIINRMSEDLSNLPQGNTNQEKESLSKVYAFFTLKGCADETGLDLNKFN